MAIDFPVLPIVNQTHTDPISGNKYYWTGTYWRGVFAQGTKGDKGDNTNALGIEPVVAVPALDVDCSIGTYFTKTIAGNSTFTFSNAPTSGNAYSFTLEVTHTSGTITWPSSVKWPSDTTPTLTTGRTHMFVFTTRNGGTRWRGSALVDYVT